MQGNGEAAEVDDAEPAFHVSGGGRLLRFPPPGCGAPVIQEHVVPVVGVVLVDQVLFPPVYVAVADSGELGPGSSDQVDREDHLVDVHF